MLGTIGFAGLAGLASIFSPCVLPIVPLVLGAASAETKWGPAALATGLAISFTAVGLFIATIGFAIGLDATVFRAGAAILMIALGAILMVPQLQMKFAVASGPVANRIGRKFGGFSTSGVSGQLGVGILLGVVWSPCVGPTLGAASVLASRGEDLGSVAITMLAFGIGASVPLLLLGMLSRETMTRWRGRMAATGYGLRTAMGAILTVFGLLVLTGVDKVVETWLVDASPLWLTDLTTRF
ncbi:cytochrome C biogenesis protein [Phyllobacterium brassicacearum]|uniref:Cytochrome C biogenesis protein n=1 Tax=Phyllobacterium brassicacearum TaxID=314235 RepID=A0A2P7B8X7_9HYPH|nr:cytochrome c biogenesis CcdA family protein [Phyllobacterium brassicacearum]PSH62924.1 cytochrome C biogenesis protein [Phyllobacterium brassicacearum]TDQ13660.1 cytochrome c biogenesis protein CcdA [Phyllobacterium brassicacearum]